MNEPVFPDLDPELESRIVALVMGEASDFERDQIEELLRQDPELMACKEHFEQLHGVLQEVGAEDDPPGSPNWKLPEAKRSDLLRVLSSEPPESQTSQGEPVSRVSVAKGEQDRWRSRWNLRHIGLVVTAASTLVVAGLFYLLRWHRDSVVTRAMSNSLLYQEANDMAAGTDLVWQDSQSSNEQFGYRYSLGQVPASAGAGPQDFGTVAGAELGQLSDSMSIVTGLNEVEGFGDQAGLGYFGAPAQQETPDSVQLGLRDAQQGLAEGRRELSTGLAYALPTQKRDSVGSLYESLESTLNSPESAPEQDMAMEGAMDHFYFEPQGQQDPAAAVKSRQVDSSVLSITPSRGQASQPSSDLLATDFGRQNTSLESARSQQAVDSPGAMDGLDFDSVTESRVAGTPPVANSLGDTTKPSERPATSPVPTRGRIAVPDAGGALLGGIRVEATQPDGESTFDDAGVAGPEDAPNSKAELPRFQAGKEVLGEPVVSFETGTADGSGAAASRSIAIADPGTNPSGGEAWEDVARGGREATGGLLFGIEGKGKGYTDYMMDVERTDDVAEEQLGRRMQADDQANVQPSTVAGIAAGAEWGAAVPKDTAPAAPNNSNFGWFQRRADAATDAWSFQSEIGEGVVGDEALNASPPLADLNQQADADEDFAIDGRFEAGSGRVDPRTPRIIIGEEEEMAGIPSATQRYRSEIEKLSELNKFSENVLRGESSEQEMDLSLTQPKSEALAQNLFSKEPRQRSEQSQPSRFFRGLGVDAKADVNEFVVPKYSAETETIKEASREAEPTGNITERGSRLSRRSKSAAAASGYEVGRFGTTNWKKGSTESLLDAEKRVVAEELQETAAKENRFSTFSLHVTDVSFKLALAALGRGEWPQADKIRIEEFLNAFDYGDPLPSIDEKVACQVEQAVHPFLQQRNLLRVSMRTAAAGRAAATPLRLTLLLDKSGSMERPDRRATIQRAVQSLAQQLTPQDQVTLISFASTPRLLAEAVPAQRAAELVGLVEGSPSEGGTNIEEALLLAFEKAKAQQLQGAQNRVIMFTDGAVNLGDANAESLARLVVEMRDSGIAFDAAGISAQDLNDEVLEALTRKGDGRYYLLDSVEDAETGFSQQLAGGLRPAAKNVKVQLEFNPARVGKYKLLGYEKHRLNKEDFRNDAVDAAELSAAEAGVAVYQFEPMADGDGDVGSISVRFQDLETGRMVERRWPIPYQPNAPAVDTASESMRLATAAVMFAAKLRGQALGEVVDLRVVDQWIASLSQSGNNARLSQLRSMVQVAQSLMTN